MLLPPFIFYVDCFFGVPSSVSLFFRFFIYLPNSPLHYSARKTFTSRIFILGTLQKSYYGTNYKNYFVFSVVWPEGRRHLEDIVVGGKVIIIIREVGWSGMDWIYLAQVRVQ
jgi:hypothetical protein